MVVVVRLGWMASTRLIRCRVFGGAQGGVAEQRVDRGQPGVAGGGAVASDGFQVLQEGADRGGVQVG